jgi:poly-gamma-glutamate synthesis protein (capsule biosynthesis protein)
VGIAYLWAMLNRRKFRPTRPFSPKGKFLVACVRGIFGLRRLFGGRDYDAVWPEHHEDPLYMKRKEQVYFGHKYYYRAITKDDPDSGIAKRLSSGDGDLGLPMHAENGTTITLSAGGDLMPYACINAKQCKHLWDEVGEAFFQADIVTANLETPIDVKKPASVVPEVMLNHMYFNGSEEMFEVFSGNGKYKGYDVLSVANNHSLDLGIQGLHNTLEFLENKKIAYCGAAKSQELRDAFPILERKGIRIAFLAATFSLNAEQLPEDKNWMVNHLSLNRENPDIDVLVQQAKRAREKGADLIVAHLHMGCAYQPFPSGHTVRNMEKICRATGIDLVLGGHPHNPQPTEIFRYPDPFTGEEKQSLVVYSMGDFVAYDIFKWCHLPITYRFHITKKDAKTFISKVEPQVYFAEANFRSGKVDRLQFRNYSRLQQQRNFIDAASEKEFVELEQFAKQFLLPGNLSQWMSKTL